MLKLDVLVLSVHPDDAELGCAGTLLKLKSQGKKIGIVDLTRGELGTRGSAEIRAQEAAAAAKILQLDIRENLELPDGFFIHSPENSLRIVTIIRKYQPEIVLLNATHDRHPDHGRAAKLCSEACFLSGLIKIKTIFESKEQVAWRPKQVYHFIQDRYIKPDFLVDVAPFVDQKMASILAYTSQFYNPNTNEPESPISSAAFLEFIKARMRTMGREAGIEYAEGFTVERPILINNLFDLL